MSPRTRKVPVLEAHVVAGVLDGAPASPRMASRPRYSPCSTVTIELPVLHRVAQAVDGAHRGDDDHVLALHQAGRGAEPQPLDVLVDRRVLLDVHVGGRDVGLGLVVVVVGNEVLDGVAGQELPQLAVELGGEGLVVGQDQRRAAVAGDALARVIVLPEPVTPRSVWYRSPRRSPAVSSAMARGWSPAGWKGRLDLKGRVRHGGRLHRSGRSVRSPITLPSSGVASTAAPATGITERRQCRTRAQAANAGRP